MDINDINKPFAINGDRTPFSYEVNVDGLLSWLGGYPIDYALKPEEGGRYIERAEFNEILYLLSSLLLKLQNNSLNSNDINDITNSLNNKLDARIYYNDKNYFVTTNTNQYINSEKTFNVTPKAINNPSDPNHLVRKGYVDNYLVQGLGVGQRYYNFNTGQRILNEVYTNTTKKPILWFFDFILTIIWSINIEKNRFEGLVDDAVVYDPDLKQFAKNFYYPNQSNNVNNFRIVSRSIIIPPGSTYKLKFIEDGSGIRIKIVNWIELR